MASKFGDVFKGVDDFFKKTFSFGHTVEVKAKTESGVKVTATGAVNGASLDTKFKAEAPIFGGLTLDKLEVSATKQTADVEFSFAEEDLVPGTKITFKGHDEARGVSEGKPAQSATVAFESKHDLVTVDGEVDVFGATAKVNAAGAFDNIVAGVSVAGGLGENGVQVSAFDVLAAYVTKATTVAAKTADHFSALNIGIQSKKNDAKFTVRATVPTPFAAKAEADDGEEEEAAGVPITVDGGVSFQPARDVTVAGAVASTGKVTVGYALNTAPGCTFNAAAEVDAANIGTSAHKFGTKFTMDF